LDFLGFKKTSQTLVILDQFF